MKQLIECVPNFSEGRDMHVIKQITDVIESIDGVKLLDVDPGAATNRTVVTFVGTPDEVVEAALQAIKKASQLIDMQKTQRCTSTVWCDRCLSPCTGFKYNNGRNCRVC